MAGANPALNINETSEIFASPDASRRGAKPAPDVLERAIAATHHDAPHANGPNRNQKAAIIVRLLQGDGEGLSLAGLDATALTKLVHGMAELSFVDEATVLQVIQEFLTDIDSFALHFQPGLQGAIEQLGSDLPEDIARKLRTAPPPVVPDDPWSAIAQMDVSEILSVIADETPQVLAIVLSKIQPVKAAEVLSELPEEKASAATKAAIGVGVIGDKTVAQIGDTLIRQSLDTSADGALSGSPIERVGAILNFAPGKTREALLREIETQHQETGEQIRQIMFTFADIPDRVEIKDIAKVVRSVDSDILVTALAGAMTSDKGSAEFILSNLSKRLGEQLTEEVQEVGEVKQKDADAAMNMIIQSIRDLEDSGEITLISPQE